MNIILAIGTIDDLIIRMMQDIVLERAARAQADPLHQRREHHLPLEQRAPRPVQGLNHAISEGKALRMQAKQLDKRIQVAQTAWDQGKGGCSWHDWDMLLAEREWAWDEALLSTPATMPLHQRRVATDAMALASTQDLDGYRMFPF